MGGDQRQPLVSPDRLPARDLVYRTYGSDNEDKNNYSDDYTKRMFEQQRKQREELMNALSRLGIIESLQPQGMQPMVPYRMPEQEFGF